ncbi:hypothetical protein [Clostridium sp.]|uniref:hypothetical protein n=1 Tax=Clostridium sp. TaxID=1506 RepID=UPI001A3B9783|nr:hypothetical protein [Clostridium sp.]MBK5241054.1 hypothetical protein [Clostridium sp.]
MLGQSESYVIHIYIAGTEVLNKSVKWSLKNQDNSTPVMGSVIENIGNSCTVEIGNESSYVNKYVVLSATLTDNPSITINKLIQIKKLN